MILISNIQVVDVNDMNANRFHDCVDFIIVGEKKSIHEKIRDMVDVARVRKLLICV